MYLQISINNYASIVIFPKGALQTIIITKIPALSKFINRNN